MELKELKDKILEALYSALPITALVYLMALTPWFEFSNVELITFTIGAVLLVVGIGSIGRRHSDVLYSALGCRDITLWDPIPERAKEHRLR